MLKIIIDTIRVKTFTASLTPVLVAHFLYEGQVSITIFAALSACFIQLGTNLYNDAKDSELGVDTSERLGPLRAVHLKVISTKTLKSWSHISFLVAVIFGVPLVIKGGVVIFLIGVVSIFLGYAYTGAFGVNLSRSGFSDIAVIIFFGVIPLTALSFLYTGKIPESSWIIGTGFGLLANVLLSVNNIRDLKTDKTAGRKTVPIRLGERNARIFASLQVIFGTLLLLLETPMGLISAALGVYLVYRIMFLNDWNKTLALSGLLHFVSGILMVISGLYLD